MEIREHFVKSGNWLFRWRSFLPLAMIVLVLLGLNDFRYPSGNHSLDLEWEIFCFAIGLAGLAVRALTVGCVTDGTSGRNTRDQEARVLNTTGMYSVVRHPLYLGNYLMWLAVILLTRTWYVPTVMTLAFWLYYERIMFAEEAFLRERFGEEFSSWARRTPAILPAFKAWKSPSLPFSVRTVLRREYSGLFGLVVAFTVVEMMEDFAATGSIQIDRLWATVFGCTLVVYLLLRTLKRRTGLLNVEGR